MLGALLEFLLTELNEVSQCARRLNDLIDDEHIMKADDILWRSWFAVRFQLIGIDLQEVMFDQPRRDRRCWIFNHRKTFSERKRIGSYPTWQQASVRHLSKWREVGSTWELLGKETRKNKYLKRTTITWKEKDDDEEEVYWNRRRIDSDHKTTTRNEEFILGLWSIKVCLLDHRNDRSTWSTSVDERRIIRCRDTTDSKWCPSKSHWWKTTYNN